MATSISTSGDMYTTGPVFISTSGDIYIAGPLSILASGDLYVAGTFAASGFLNSENVVFYHPLDNYVDGIQGETWAGSAAFSSAIISSGIGSARLGGPLVSQGTSIAQSRYLYGSWLAPIIGDDDRALLFHNYTDDYVRACILTVNDNEIVLSDTDNLYPISGGILVNIGKNHAIHVSGNFYAASVAIGNLPNSDYAIMLATATVDGATVSWNIPIGFGRDGQHVGMFHSLSAIPNTPSGGFLLSHSNVDDDSIRIHYCYIDESGNPYASSPIIITSGDYAQVGVLDSNKAIITYRDLTNNQNSVRIINISGTTLSLENPMIYISDDFDYNNDLSIINSSGFLTSNRLGINDSCHFTIHRVSGSTIDVMSSGMVSGIPSNFLTSIYTTYDDQQQRGLYQFTNYGGAEAISCGYFTIDDDYNINVGRRTDYSFTQNLEPTSETPITWLGNDKFLSFIKIFVGQTQIAYVIQDKANEIYSQIPSAYPQAIGASGLTLGAWTNMSSISGTVFKAGRDCSIQIISDYISLGSGTAYWNDSAITDLISSIDDDQSHFLIVDFRYQGENNWKLYTSLDGQNWVDQGIQNSGSQEPIETISAPNIGFADEDMDQLLDEVILWKDTDQFDSLELLRLHALGGIYDKPMNEYQYNLVSLPYSGSCDLYIQGYIDATSSMSLFIFAPPPDLYNTKSLYMSGPTLCTISGNLFSFGIYVASKSGSLFALGPQQITISKDLFINGLDVQSESIPLFIFAPPPSLYNTKSLYVPGFTLFNSSGNIYIEGYQFTIASCDLFIGETIGPLAKPLDWLLKSSDHNPQILGTLEGATNVNIQLWEITDGQNAQVSIMSSGCYQIGNTGRWAWSTVNLPTYTTYQRQYFYLMTANNNETFDGQFFLKLPERAKWIYPRNQSEYIK